MTNFLSVYPFSVCSVGNTIIYPYGLNSLELIGRYASLHWKASDCIQTAWSVHAHHVLPTTAFRDTHSLDKLIAHILNPSML